MHLIKYNSYQWKICSDLKVVGILMGLRKGFVKFSCFICLWDSRCRSEHYTKQNWPNRYDYSVGESSVVAEPLVDRDNIIIPPLHVKLNLVKNFIKSLDKTGEAIQFLKEKLSKLSVFKIQEGVFTGLDIKKIMKDFEHY